MPSPSSTSVLPPRPLRLAGGAAVALGIAALVVTLLGTLALAANGQGSGGSAGVDIAHLLRMTALQAGLSTVLSLALGMALAWALNRLRFVGRSVLVALFAAAIVTPGIVLAFGLLAVWGRSGWGSIALHALFGTTPGSLAYGLPGILFAHLILDGAFAARVLLSRLDALPATRLKTGQSLGLGAVRRFILIDWPAMRGALPGLGTIIFLLAFTSFPIVLLLGGGPGNQTLEVAIYSAVRLDFDLGAAVRLALLQILVCGSVIALAAGFPPVSVPVGPSTDVLWRDSAPARLIQWTVLTLCSGLLALPLAAVLANGIGDNLVAVLSDGAFWSAAVTSLTVGTCSAALALALALSLCLARAATASLPARVILGSPGFVYLAVPSVVLALGFFLLARNSGIAAEKAAPLVVVGANALLSLPFAVATLGPPLDALARGHGRLIRSLGIGGMRQLVRVELPLVGREIGVVLALAFCFSLGDLGVLALFGTQEFVTLPLLMVRALGAYRSNDAGVIAALLLMLTLAAFVALPKLFGTLLDARAR